MTAKGADREPAVAQVVRSADELEDLVTGIFAAAGLEDDEARRLTRILIEAELWGRASHGLQQVERLVERLAREGRGRWRVVAEEPGRRYVDGCGDIGYLLADDCVAWLLAELERSDAALVAVRGASHNGMLGYYTHRLARGGLIGVAVADCIPLMAPYGGRERFFGTNPISLAFPRREGEPIVVDLATSAIAWGDVLLLARFGGTLPPDVALGPDGEPTTDPDAALAGAVLPMAGPKGSALALAVQLLCSAFVGAPAVPSRGQAGTGLDYGNLYLAVRPDLFVPRQEYEETVEELVEGLLAVPAREGMEVRLPGAASAGRRAERRRRGITVPMPLWERLEVLAAQAEPVPASADEPAAAEAEEE